MIRLLATLLCIATLASSANAQLPEDASRYQLIAVTAETPSPMGAALLSQLTSHPGVAAFASQCHLHKWTPHTTIYQERYGQSLPSDVLPIIALARADGGVIYKASGSNVPATGEQLVESLARAATAEAANQRQQSAADDCPACPRRPTPPALPDRPRLPDWRPLDGMIPDTVTVDVGLPKIPTWAIGVGVGVLVIGCLGGLALVVIAGVVAFVNLR